VVAMLVELGNTQPESIHIEVSAKITFDFE